MTKSPEEFDQRTLVSRTAAALRAHPETLAVRVSREHYLWLADEIAALEGRLKSIITELGGNVEGQPTSMINYLQRIRQLRKQKE
jgi:hypothetical protein